jgi:large subunit ribosomal protein L22
MSKVRRGKMVSVARLERKHGGNEKAPTAKKVYPQGFYGATLRGIRLAPQKARLVADQIRGQTADRAREILRYSSKRAAYYYDRILLSALGNAEALTEGRVSTEELIVVEAYADEGTRLKRFLAGPHGRARPILRRLCHMTVVLGPAAEIVDAVAAENESKKD